jgi:hypothetical protein
MKVMENNFLTTYRDGQFWNFQWFSSEEEVLDWIENDAGDYSEVEVVELRVIRTLYKDGFRILE